MENNSDPVENFSIGYAGVSPPVDADGNKKRRLEDEALALPFSKHKCIVQRSDSKYEPLIFEEESMESAVGISTINLPSESKDRGPGIMPTDAFLLRWGEQGCVQLAPRSAESGSYSASNSFVGEYETSIYIEIGGKTELSGSSESCSKSSFKRSPYSLASQTLKRKTEDSEGAGALADMSKEPKPPLKRINFLDAEGSSTYMSELPYTEDGPLLELGISHADLVNIEGYQDTNDEALEYLSETSPPLYALLSGTPSANQGIAECKRKPTIDQEFEQYFSSLML